MTSNPDLMKAAVCRAYGGPEQLEVCSIERPKPRAGELLIEVRASAINPVDWKTLRGDLRLVFGRKPPRVLGGDFAGIVAEAPPESCFQAGDRVWGMLGYLQLRSTTGTYAQYIRCPHQALDRMPSNLDFNEAASLPLTALTAYQGLVHHARLEAGQRVLINGCSGGVGLCALQIAKAMGASVTGVCSAANLETVLALGADAVIDYQHEELLQARPPFDVWFDVVGNQRLGTVAHQLKTGGTYLNIVTLGSTLASSLLNPFRSRQAHAVFVHPSATDLAALRPWVETGALRPKIAGIYALDDLGAAHQRSQEGRVVGKLVVTL